MTFEDALNPLLGGIALGYAVGVGRSIVRGCTAWLQRPRNPKEIAS